jgi:hypothetical protein
MLSLSHVGLRTSAVAVLLGLGLVSPRVVENLVTRADARSGRIAERTTLGRGEAGMASPPLVGVRPTVVARGTLLEDAPSCSVALTHPEGLPAERRVALTDLVSDRGCPAELNTTIGLTFEIDNPKPSRNLWWRRAESSFDVLYPSSGSIAAVGKNRVSLSNLVLDQTVTIEVLEADQRLMSFTLKHF